ncbi:hypothetical protein SYNPS1DRAFT_30889 [Syncephalis pseudoplumigaleata]|uniref:Uncharacterized protein n=1 Tax=Syncephalis pseudoplumigaleata TaxID=1712513 RepID=A0A4P9YTQ8_9FUNG|nr:hypothetical protein SYNPS1DRAFT_30889 [Syncephalis pseudoplumigaleata]|eukprot:RKP23373.1 hypothetical protein SYNPS1DRAFT_30889 [Syncephalis pseudoplumigaleata]
MPEHAIQHIAALTDARHPAASSMNINAAPVLVIERIAAVADSPSLVLLASCNRHLWQCIRGLQHYWKQRYMQEHPLEDDEELSWLRWYIKTLRASGLLASSASDGDIDWFRAYCHRHACDANGFKNDPKRVKDVEEVTVRSKSRDIVLDPVLHHTILISSSTASQGEDRSVIDTGANIQYMTLTLTATPASVNAS